jgi:hypothetical protein
VPVRVPLSFMKEVGDVVGLLSKAKRSCLYVPISTCRNVSAAVGIGGRTTAGSGILPARSSLSRTAPAIRKECRISAWSFRVVFMLLSASRLPGVGRMAKTI